MSAPATFRRLRLKAFGEDLRRVAEIVEAPWPQPGPGEIVIRNRFAGCNALFDAMLARNKIEYRMPAPPIDLGVEAVGEVTAVGAGVTDFAVGDAALTSTLGSGYREAQRVSAKEAVKAPAATAEVCALSPTAVSALVGLERVAELKPGETIAIAAAAGGLGHFLVQFAKMKGARVVGICGGPEKARLLGELGCDAVIDRRARPLAEALASDFKDGLDVAYDTVGREVFDAFLDNLAPHGRLVVSGYAMDQGPEGVEAVTGPRVYAKIYWKSASIRAYQNALYKEFQDEARARIFKMYAEGRLRPVIDPARFEGLGGVFDAIEHLLSGRSIGKVVVAL